MAELTFSPVFQEISSCFTEEQFSAMYFGRHCDKNLLILKHNITIMLVFGDDLQWSKPELIKSVIPRENTGKGVQIVGNENAILLLDEHGKVWNLINAFDIYQKKFESLHILANRCFYEWVPFKKFNFVKILAMCATKQGFACIGVNLKLEKKLAVLPSMDLPIEEFTFDGLNTLDSVSYYLTYINIDIENSLLKNTLDSTKETLLVSNRLRGTTYLCTRDGKNCLINKSNISLISTVDYLHEECVILCFESGKLFFYFYNKPEKQCTVYLSKKLVAVEKCCCASFCLLWTDGIDLHHTKFTLKSDNSNVKLSDLKLLCAVHCPFSLLQINNCVLAVTLNNNYYVITAGSVPAVEIKRTPKEFLSVINDRSWVVDELEQNIEMLSHYLYCKDIMENFNMKEKVEIKWEGNNLIIKSLLGICLRHEFWKLRLKTEECNKEFVHIIDFKFDLSEGMHIKIDNPFKNKNKSKLKLSLIGYFGGTGLFLDLGEVSKAENDEKKSEVRQCLTNILKKRNPSYMIE